MVHFAKKELTNAAKRTDFFNGNLKVRKELKKRPGTTPKKEK